MIALPEILTDERYMESWYWDGWKPCAKADAPQVVRDEIQAWLAEIEKAEREGIFL